MSEILQQLFNFYFHGGWLWMALVPLILLVFILMDNQRRQRQALTWMLFLAGCLLVFTPSLFYSLSDGRTLNQSTREIFYAGILGVTGAILGLIGYVMSFQWRVPQSSVGRAYPADVLPLKHEDVSEEPLTEIIEQKMPVYQSQGHGLHQPLRTAVPVAGLPDERFRGAPVVDQTAFAPGWLEDPTGRPYRLYRGVTNVGRDDDQQIRLTDLSVSRRHVLIRYEQYARGDAFLLQAIGKSETALNGVILGPETKQLYHGDRLRLGVVEFTFFIHAGR